MQIQNKEFLITLLKSLLKFDDIEIIKCTLESIIDSLENEEQIVEKTFH